MQRTCNGADPNLVRPLDPAAQPIDYQPCDCGLTFDDTRHLVVWPHQAIPNVDDKAAMIAWLAQLFDLPEAWLHHQRPALPAIPHRGLASMGVPPPHPVEPGPSEPPADYDG